MYDSARELIEALRATPDTLGALLRGLTTEAARAPRAGDSWSILVVVCHLRDAEAFALGRLRALRDDPAPRITGFDQEGWVAERDYAGDDLDAAFAAFRRGRAAHLAALAALPPGAWSRVGQHDRLGPVSILNHTLHMAWHDAIHLAQIGRQVAEWRMENGE
jgi:hypothetical protein